MLLSVLDSLGDGALCHGSSGVQAARGNDAHTAGHEDTHGENRGEDTAGVYVCVCGGGRGVTYVVTYVMQWGIELYCGVTFSSLLCIFGCAHI